MDLVAVSLVSCMVMAIGGVWEYVARSWRHDIVVLNEEAFQVIMYDSSLVNIVSRCGGNWVFSVGGVGCIYSMISSLHLNAYVRSEVWERFLHVLNG